MTLANFCLLFRSIKEIMYLKAKYDLIDLFKKNLYSYKLLEKLYYKLLAITSLVLRDVFAKSIGNILRGHFLSAPSAT